MTFAEVFSNETEPRAPSPEGLILHLSAAMMGMMGILTLSLITIRTGAVGPQNPPDLRSSPNSSGSRTPETERAPSTPLIELPSHPSQKLNPYFTPAAPASVSSPPPHLRKFHDLLEQYVHQQTQDDNFTIRVLDRRTGTVLEVFSLTNLRQKYKNQDHWDWREVDEHRWDAMERLVDKYVQRGVPLEEISVRWGRANQVRSAHERGRPYRFYERRLAKYLGLSLLATEIGTVETFNQDHLVSPVGARSRYQLMPWILRRSGVNEYALPTEAETYIQVQESLHPLLVLEPAFLLLRGYVNAVGHEIPGLSAYHTGPGNIYKLYRRYYTESNTFPVHSTVADAYVWAVTTGFDIVREGSTFGSDSRGYVPALYGSLKARDQQSPSPSSALRAARVEIRPDTSVFLRKILAALDALDRTFDWGSTGEETIYRRFRTLNPHFHLPPAPDGGVPSTGNVRLVSEIEGKAVRFFLPLEAPAALRTAGLHVLDSTATFRFDESTYTPPSPGQITRWDRKYRALIDDIKHFGFTQQNRTRLLQLHERFEFLAERTPTRFRRRQLRIIDIHRRLWLSNPWEQLAAATKEALGPWPVKVQPPDSLGFPRFDRQELKQIVPQ